MVCFQKLKISTFLAYSWWQMLILYLVQGDCTPWPLLRDASNSVWCSENLIDTQCFDDLVFTLLPQIFELNRFFSVLISRPYGTLKYLTVLQINQQFMMKIKEKMELKQFQNKKLLCTLRQFFSKQQARRFCKFQFFAKYSINKKRQKNKDGKKVDLQVYLESKF